MDGEGPSKGDSCLLISAMLATWSFLENLGHGSHPHPLRSRRDQFKMRNHFYSALLPASGRFYGLEGMTKKKVKGMGGEGRRREGKERKRKIDPGACSARK